MNASATVFRGYACRISGSTCPVTSRRGDSLADQASEKLGGLDIPVNNAGKQIAIERIEDLDDKQVLKGFQVNILAMFTITRAALKHFPDGASIINSTRSKPTTPRPRSWTTPRARRPSMPSPKVLPFSWPRAPSESRPSPPVRSGPHCRFPTGTPRTSCRSSGTMYRWVEPDSRWNWHQLSSS
jgi:hypothetical protein